jgi:hypothetical protein
MYSREKDSYTGGGWGPSRDICAETWKKQDMAAKQVVTIQSICV